MKKFILCLIALFCVIGLVGAWQLRQPQIQKKIVLSLMPPESRLGSIQIDSKSITVEKIKVPLKNGSSIEIGALRAQYDLWQSVKNRRIQLMDCHIDGCMLEVSEKNVARRPTQKHSSTAQTGADGRMPQLKIPPLSIRRLQLAGALNVQDQLNSQFGLEAKNIGLDQICELSLTANTEFEGIPIDRIEAILNGRFEMTTDGQICLHSLALNAHSQDLTAQIEMLKSTDVENRIFWEGTLNYAKKTPQVYALGNTTLSVNNAELILNGSIQPGLKASIDQAQLQLMTTPFGNIEVHSRQSIHYPLLADIDGELCSIRIPKLALSAVRDWLPTGYSLKSDTAANHFVLSKEEDQYVLRSEQQIHWDAVELMGPHGPMATEIDSIKLSPEIYFKPPESLAIMIPDLTISHGSQPLLKTKIEASGPLSQLSAFNFKSQFSIIPDGIPDLSISDDLIISGTLHYKHSNEWPIQLATQLIPKSQTIDQDSLELRLLSQLTPHERLPIKIHAYIGQQPTPSSEFQLNATLNLKHKPLQVSAQIESPNSRFSDLKRWLARFSPANYPQMTHPSKARADSGKATKTPRSTEAVWGAIDAQVTTHIKNLTIDPEHIVSNLRFNSEISPNHLIINDFKAQIDGASIEAILQSDFAPLAKPHYRNQLKLSLQNMYAPNFIPAQQSWKIDGFFEGVLNVRGQADDYLTAWKNSLGRLTLSSHDGRLELLELSRRKSLGIAGAELLGFGLAALLDQPEIHTKTQAGVALVHYFKNIDYQAIELECVRETLEFIDISKLQLLSPDLRIEGLGAIGAQSIQQLLQQPLVCELSFASKGAIIESLGALDLIEAPPDADKFYNWKPQFEISGSLDNLDASSFSDFFQHEAYELLHSPSQTDDSNMPKINLENGIDVIEKLFSL